MATKAEEQITDPAQTKDDSQPSDSNDDKAESDLHLQTAQKLFSKAVVSDVERRIAKQVSYAAVYGCNNALDFMGYANAN